VINAGGKLRVLVTCEHKLKSGRLILNFRSGGEIRKTEIPGSFGRDPKHDKATITDQKFSIHPRTKSGLYNQIHFTSVTSRGRRDEYCLTAAIKKGDRFAPVAVKRCSSLVNSKYDLKGGELTQSLGDYDNSHFTLIFAVYVSAASCEFAAEHDDFNTIQHEFGDFRLVILWSFFKLAPELGSATIGVKTQDPTIVIDLEHQEANRMLIEGYSGEQAVGFFKHTRDLLRDEAIRTMGKSLTESQVALARARYYRDYRQTTKSS
jgi:hypothetical protein